MVSVLHANKHFIKFPIALDYTTLRGRNKMENSTDSTGCTNCSTMLLKADTGANVNLMNKQTFDQLFGKAKDLLQLTPIRMENYGNTAVKVLGRFHAFLCWKDKVYKQTFYVTVTDPPICCLGMLVTHLEFSSLVTPWKNSLVLAKIPQTLLGHKQYPSMHQKVTQKVDIHFFIRK